MGLFDFLFGRGRPHRPSPRARGSGPLMEEQALARYRSLLRTAPPGDVEEMHREAFARLTPEQRARALRELNARVPLREQVWRDDPASLARLATRAESLRPGSLVQALGQPRLGGLLAGGLLSSLVGSALGTMLAHELLDDPYGAPDLADMGPADLPDAAFEAEGPDAADADWEAEGGWGGDLYDDV